MSCPAKGTTRWRSDTSILPGDATPQRSANRPHRPLLRGRSQQPARASFVQSRPRSRRLSRAVIGIRCPYAATPVSGERERDRSGATSGRIVRAASGRGGSWPVGTSSVTPTTITYCPRRSECRDPADDNTDRSSTAAVRRSAGRPSFRRCGRAAGIMTG
jgi:hypothetical protein